MMKKNMLKISKKVFLLLLAVSITLCGCTPNVKESNNNEKIEDISFSGLDDTKLQDYVMETLYSGINSEFTNEDYVIKEMATVYVSKEYIEELDYNTKSNIYFGYTPSELSKKFKGKKYVFEVGKDNQTTVVEFKDYEDTYNKMIKNVAIGSGVILVCTTVSISTGGTVGMFFAASAKNATEFALTSASLSGVISSSIEYYKTGAVDKSLKKGMLDASDGFKWGAILGGITGGLEKTITNANAAKELKYMNFAERGARAEARAFKKYGGRKQVLYFNGKEIASPIKGATKPDLVRTIKGKLEAIEVKNYNLNNKTCRKNLIKEIKREVTNRVKHLPKGSKQRIVLDIQGRNYSKKITKGVTKGIKEACKDVYPDLPVDIMT